MLKLSKRLLGLNPEEHTADRSACDPLIRGAILGKKTGMVARIRARATGARVRRRSGPERPCLTKIVDAPGKPQWKLWRDSGLHAAWIGHSTVLLRIDGYTILTDPVFSDRCGVRLGPITVGLKRLVAPALSMPQLPPIDMILLSHAHMDHFDIPSLHALERSGVTIVTARCTSDLLRVRRYGAVHEVGWGERVRVGPVSIRGIQVNHWGARMHTDVHRGYNGYLVESDRHRILFAGDTADTNEFRSLRTSKPIDLAIMPIGAYNPWIYAHCNPEQAMRMANEAGADQLLPIHHQTFQLSREPLIEPIERFLSAAGQHTDRVVTQRIGDEWAGL